MEEAGWQVLRNRPQHCRALFPAKRHISDIAMTSGTIRMGSQPILDTQAIRPSSDTSVLSWRHWPWRRRL